MKKKYFIFFLVFSLLFFGIGLKIEKIKAAEPSPEEQCSPPNTINCCEMVGMPYDSLQKCCESYFGICKDVWEGDSQKFNARGCMLKCTASGGRYGCTILPKREDCCSGNCCAKAAGDQTRLQNCCNSYFKACNSVDTPYTTKPCSEVSFNVMGCPLQEMTITTDTSISVNGCGVNPTLDQCTKREATKWCPEFKTLLDIPDLLLCLIQATFSGFVKLPALFLGIVGLIFSFVTAFLYAVFLALANHFINLSLEMSTFNPSYVLVVQAILQKISIYLILIFIAFIGLGNIFGWGAYTRKQLGSLLTAAILIFFSSTIVDLIVRVGNLFTDFFLTIAGTRGNFLQLAFDKALEILMRHVNNTFGKITEFIFMDGKFFECFLTTCQVEGQERGPFVLKIAAFAFSSFILAFFFLFEALVMIFYAFVFLFRIIWIWVLKAAAPLAFFAWGLRSQEIKRALVGPLHWDNWWSGLLTWSFIGVPLALFLVIANGILTPVTPGQIKFEVGGNEIAQIENKTKDRLNEAVGAASAETAFDYNFEMVLSDMVAPLVATFTLFLGATLSPGPMGEFGKKAYGLAMSGMALAGSYSKSFSLRKMPKRVAMGLKRLETAPLVGALATATLRARDKAISQWAKGFAETHSLGAVLGKIKSPTLNEGEKRALLKELFENQGEKFKEGIKAGLITESEFENWLEVKDTNIRMEILENMLKTNVFRMAIDKGLINQGTLNEMWGLAGRELKVEMFKSRPDYFMQIINTLPDGERRYFARMLTPQVINSLPLDIGMNFILLQGLIAREATPETLLAFLKKYLGYEPRVKDLISSGNIEALKSINPVNARVLEKWVRRNLNP